MGIEREQMTGYRLEMYRQRLRRRLACTRNIVRRAFQSSLSALVRPGWIPTSFPWCLWQPRLCITVLAEHCSATTQLSDYGPGISRRLTVTSLFSYCVTAGPIASPPISTKSKFIRECVLLRCRLRIVKALPALKCFIGRVVMAIGTCSDGLATLTTLSVVTSLHGRCPASCACLTRSSSGARRWMERAS